MFGDVRRQATQSYRYVHTRTALPQLYIVMFSHGRHSMSRKIQLMVLPNTSGNRKAPRKCQSQTLANLSISASSACGCKFSKRSVIHNNETLEVFLKFTKDNETRWIQESNASIKYGSIAYFFCILIVRWKKATELSHQLSPVIVVNYTCHWKSPQPKAKDSLHVLHGQGHLTAR